MDSLYREILYDLLWRYLFQFHWMDSGLDNNTLWINEIEPFNSIEWIQDFGEVWE